MINKGANIGGGIVAAWWRHGGIMVALVDAPVPYSHNFLHRAKLHLKIKKNIGYLGGDILTRAGSNNRSDTRYYLLLSKLLFN